MILHDLPTTKKLNKNRGSPFTNHLEYLVNNNIVATYSRDASGAQALAQRCVYCVELEISLSCNESMSLSTAQSTSTSLLTPNSFDLTSKWV